MSNLFTINWQDALGGLISAIVFALAQLGIQMAQQQTTIDLKQIGWTALLAACSYIVTRFAHDDKNNPLGVS